MQHIDLPRTRMPGRQHTDKSADVGVPDIAVTIDSDAERPGIITGERKDPDVAVAQPPEARAAHHAEPDVAVRSHGNTAETRIFATRLDIRELSILEAPNAIGSKLQKPHRAVGAERDVRRHGAATREVECPAGPVGSDVEQLVAVLQRRPYSAVCRHRDSIGPASRGLDLMAGKNSVLQPGHAIAG